MVLKELVTSCNEELREIQQQAESNRENPTLLRVIDILLRLTALDGSEESPAENRPALVPSKSAESAAPAVDCPHAVPDLYGRCKQCGKCLHTNEKNGTCITCGEEVPPAVNGAA